MVFAELEKHPARISPQFDVVGDLTFGAFGLDADEGLVRRCLVSSIMIGFPVSRSPWTSAVGVSFTAAPIAESAIYGRDRFATFTEPRFPHLATPSIQSRISLR